MTTTLRRSHVSKLALNPGRRRVASTLEICSDTRFLQLPRVSFPAKHTGSPAAVGRHFLPPSLFR